MLCGSVRLLEAILIAGIGGVISALYVAPSDAEGRWLYILATVGTAGTVVAVLETLGLYKSSTLCGRLSPLPRLAAGWTTAFGILLALLFFVKAGAMYSRVWLGTWYVAGLIGLAAWRVSLASLVQRWIRVGRIQRRTAIIGDKVHAQRVARSLGGVGSTATRVAVVVDDRQPTAMAELERSIRAEQIDVVILALRFSQEDRLLAVLRRIRMLPVDIRLAGDASRVRFLPRAYSYMDGLPLLDVLDRPISGWDAVKKRLFDRVCGAVALLLALPVMAVVAIAVRLESKGPILFRQARYGFKNELIYVYKFRSMYVDCTDRDATKLVTRGDPRVTRVGRFIRRTSLDELPQLLNVVIFGNLSLVGPRPHALKAKAADDLYQDVVDDYFARHRVKPGITGWAQINGWRGDTDTHEKIQQRVLHDLYYIEHWSLLFDAQILLKTPWALLLCDNAY